MTSNLQNRITERRDDLVTSRLFWTFLVVHVIVWTAVPAITESNAALDVVEMILWGHEWEWGYYKHPPLPAWIAEASVTLFGPLLWPIHLISQLCVAACFWAVWRLGRELLSPWPALTSAVLLEGCYYFQYTTIEFSNNLPAKACWAFGVLLLYWAITRNRYRDWAGLGAVIALSLLSKYDALLLALAMILFAIVHPRVRPLWRTPGPYLALSIAALMCLPHALWLVQHDLLTIDYIRQRSATEPALANHLVNPLRFLAAQGVAVSVMLALCVPVLGWRWRLSAVDDQTRFARTYLLALVLGPLLIAVLVSCFTGSRLRSMWGSPMFSYFGLMLLVTFETVRVERAFRRTIAGSAMVGGGCAMALAALNLWAPHFSGQASRIHYPGVSLAMEVERRWKTITDAPLTTIAGPWWHAGNVSLYASTRPTVYIEMSPKMSPWTSDERFRKEGGVIVWRTDVNQGSERDWLARFPEAILCQPIEVAWATGAKIPPLRLGMAMLPPQTTGSESEPTSDARTAATPGTAEVRR